MILSHIKFDSDFFSDFRERKAKLDLRSKATLIWEQNRKDELLERECKVIEIGPRSI